MIAFTLASALCIIVAILYAIKYLMRKEHEYLVDKLHSGNGSIMMQKKAIRLERLMKNEVQNLINFIFIYIGFNLIIHFMELIVFGIDVKKDLVDQLIVLICNSLCFTKIFIFFKKLTKI